MYRRYRIPTVWREMERLQREMNRLFDSTSSGRVREAPSFPAINVWADEENQIISAEMPGVTSEDIEINVIGETLTLSGQRTPDELPEGSRYHRQERGYGKFTRTIKLPYLVNAGEAQASFENGVLTVRLPRAEADKPKKVAVKAVG